MGHYYRDVVSSSSDSGRADGNKYSRWNPGHSIEVHRVSNRGGSNPNGSQRGGFVQRENDLSAPGSTHPNRLMPSQRAGS